MSTVKIEHVNPNSGRSVGFDIMSGDEVKDTFVLRHGEFRLFNMSGGLMLHEVSMAELDERERKAAEAAELEAEVARERKAKEDREHAEKVKAEREAKKAEIEAKAAEEAGEAKVDDEPHVAQYDSEVNADPVV